MDKNKELEIVDKILKILDGANPRPNIFEVLHILEKIEKAFKMQLTENIREDEKKK